MFQAVVHCSRISKLNIILTVPMKQVHDHCRAGSVFPLHPARWGLEFRWTRLPHRRMPIACGTVPEYVAWQDGFMFDAQVHADKYPSGFVNLFSKHACQSDIYLLPLHTHL